MKKKRHIIIVFIRLALIVFSVLFVAAGIAGGFKLSGGSYGEAAPKAESISETSVQIESAETVEASEVSEVSEADEEIDEIAEYIAAMSLREKLCQMLIVTPDSISDFSDTTAAGAETKAAFEKYPVGGVIHFTQNIISGEQIALYNANVQAYAKTPMFISVDEEGGDVSRLRFAIGAHSVGAMLAYEKYGGQGAFDNAKTIADSLVKYGFNTDFAPIADVWSNPANTVIGGRAYSSDFDNAAMLVAAAVRGFNESGVVCSLKHFPGHGDTREDSHDGTAYVHKTLDELRANEFKPFKAGIEAGADMVMVGHLVVPEVDDLPATLSKKLVTEVLREELGFGGVVTTDSLAMGAMLSKYSAEYVAVTSVKAGVDILLMPSDVDKTIDALTQAIQSGEIPESRIDESVARILSLKAAHGIIVNQLSSPH